MTKNSRLTKYIKGNGFKKNKPACSLKPFDPSERIDELEAVMKNNFHDVNCPVVHRFTNGMYIREIFMPAGTLVTSKIHKTQHPYTVSKGKVSVWINGGEEHIIEAPFTGITQPNTRRVLYVHEDTVWTTFHPNPDNCDSVDKIEERIMEKHDNIYLQPNDILCLG